MVGQLGEAVSVMFGVAAFACMLRFGWAMGLPLALWVTARLGVRTDIEWHRGKEEGRPPVRYIEDAWGRVVYVELDDLADGSSPGGDV